MGDQGRWFKLWTTASDDPDLANLDLADFGRWCLFGVFLKVHGQNGIVKIQEPATSLQQKFRVHGFKDVLTILNNFPNCDVREEQKNDVTPVTIVTVTWRNWRKYQGDFSGDRVTKYRSVKRAKKRGEERRREETRKEENPKEEESVPNRKKQRSGNGRLTDEEFLNALKANPAYQSIDFDRELSKLDAWLLSPRGRGKKKTQSRILWWLNHADGGTEVRPQYGQIQED